ncbi:Ada metal-binding domain-containing protein [Propionibacteriaceae bacterium G57]|uniref:Ada metal-binding domain-containing protein n=1 Tax=Aestuariimicrobium sp. G57 TaxID=3418485 RepID=UPI003DA6DB21
MGDKTYTLLDADRKPYQSSIPGTVGGHRGGRIYGCLDCPAALRAIAKGGYVKNRVFFADEATAVAAGFRPCGVCLPGKYAAWKRAREEIR